MKKIRIALMVLTGLVLQAQAAVKTGFQAGGDDAATTTVTWTNLNGVVTVSAPGVGSPTIDPAANTFTAQDSAADATLAMNVVALSELGTPGPFDPATWSGGTNDGATIHTTSVGWGVDDSNGNGNLQVGEALVLTFNFSGIAAGNEVKMLAITTSSDSTELWKKTSENSGVLVSSGSTVLTELLTDGDTYALTGVGRIQTMTMDIAAPATGVDQPTGVSSLSGDSVALLDWDDDVTGFLDYYTVYRGTASGVYDTSNNVFESSYVDSGLTSGTTYYYAVKAFGASGTPQESDFSDEVSATPFTASSDMVLIQRLDASDTLSVTTNALGEVTLWTDLSGNGNDAVDGNGDPVLWPSASLSPTGLSGMDMRTNSATLDIFSEADTDAFLDFRGGAISNNGFCVMVAFKADNVQTSVAHQIVLGDGASFDNLCLRLESDGALDASLDGVLVSKPAEMQDGEMVVVALNYKANSGLMEFWDSKTGSVSNNTADVYGDFSATGFPLSLGGDHGSRVLDGMIGEVRIFSSYLNAENFKIQREQILATWGSASADLYAPWAESYGLFGADAAETNDYEGDGLDNLMEYALGGNPTNSDAALVLPELSTDESGTWFYHIHNERDDDALTYTLDLKDDLVNDPTWETNGLEFVGQSGLTDEFRSVTNRTDLGTAEFLRLQVEK